MVLRKSDAEVIKESLNGDFVSRKGKANSFCRLVLKSNGENDEIFQLVGVI